MRSPPSSVNAATRESPRAVVTVCIAMAVVGINTTAIGVATRGIADDLNVSLSGLEWIMSAYLVTAAAFALAGGRAGDVFGRKRVFLIGCGFLAVGCVVAAMAPGTTLLVVGRAIQGIGAALVMPASIEVVAAYPPASGIRSGFRSRGVVFATAFGIGPLIGGVLTDNLSWRAVFWAELVLTLVAIVVALPLLAARSSLPKAATRDFRGAALAAGVVFLVVFIASQGRTWGWVLWPTAVLVAVAGLLTAWLARVESHTAHPLLHRDLLRDRTVLGANVATLAASIGMLGLIYFFGFFAQSGLMFNSTAMGVAFAVLPFTVAIILFSVLAEFLSRHFGVRGPVIAGLGLSVLGFAGLATVSTATTEGQLVVPLVLCGIGAGIANAGLTAPAVMTERWRIDEAAGLLSLTRFLGSAIAVAIGTASYLAVGSRSGALTAGGSDSDTHALGGSTYQRAVASLQADLRRPFEAAARESTVEAFAATMRFAAVVILVLTVISAVLLTTAKPNVAKEPARWEE